MQVLAASLSQDATDHHVPTMASLHVLDGGMGHLLKQHGLRVPGLPLEQQFLAGVLANESQPDVVMAAHTEFIDSGATVISTNSFAATRHSLARIGKQADAIKLAEVRAWRILGLIAGKDGKTAYSFTRCNAILLSDEQQ